jgi:hypothetical protein
MQIANPFVFAITLFIEAGRYVDLAKVKASAFQSSC